MLFKIGKVTSQTFSLKEITLNAVKSPHMYNLSFSQLLSLILPKSKCLKASEMSHCLTQNIKRALISPAWSYSLKQF